MKHFFGLMSKLVSKIHFPFTHKKMTEEKCIEIMTLLKDGDVVLTHTSGELSNVVLDFYGHAALFLNGRFYEATTEKVRKTHPMFFLARKDVVKVLRPKFKIEFGDALFFLEENLGDAYDFEFESNDKQFYCFELVAEALKMSSKVDIQKVKTPIGTQFLASSFEKTNFITMVEVK